ncbi:MAG TPA: CoA-transferase, partial [Acidimicrobiia bacterium]
WLQGRRIDVGFLTAAQIDRFANLNSTVIGDYAHPKSRLPGAGGAPEIAASSGEVLVILRHQPRVFVESVDFVTSVGFGRDGKGRPGCWGAGPTTVITDLGVLRPDPVSRELVLEAVHPGVEVSEVVGNTGWDLVVAEDLAVSRPPDPGELTTLRSLKERSEEAHRR